MDGKGISWSEVGNPSSSGTMKTGVAARHAAAHLFSDGLVKDPPAVELKQQLWRVISTLAEDPSPTPVEEEQSNLNEWAARSLNTIRGNCIHAVIYYAYWLKRLPPKIATARTVFRSSKKCQRLGAFWMNISISEMIHRLRSGQSMGNTSLC